MSKHSDLVNLCKGLNEYMMYAEANNYDIRKTLQGISGCVIALSPIVSLDLEQYDRDIVMLTLQKLSNIMETSISSNQHIELPLVGRHAHVLIAHPDEMAKESYDNDNESGSDEDFSPVKPADHDTPDEEKQKDSDDDWDDYGDAINDPSTFKRKIENVENNLPTSSSS